MKTTVLPAMLTSLAKELRRHDGTKETGDYLNSNAGKLQFMWRKRQAIECKRLPLPKPREQALFPKKCEIESCFMNIDYGVDEEGRPTKAAFQIELQGALYCETSAIELQDHWRIDTDVSAIESKAGSTITEGREPHPYFHFQRGGHAQDRFAEKPFFVPSAQTDLGDGDWKALMQYPGPRIPSLPFDPILAIDFCIGQNDGPLWRSLHRSPEYRVIIREAQEALWLPFFEALQKSVFRREWLGPLVLV